MSTNRYELEIMAHHTYGRTIGWMANVINTGHSSPTLKIKGLLYLAFHDRVADLPYSMDYILIDGYAVSWSVLEKYATLYRDDTEEMLAHISQVEHKSAYNLSDAKLQQDSYHKAIQIAATALVEEGKGEYEYVTSYTLSSVWRHPETGDTTLFRHNGIEA